MKPEQMGAKLGHQSEERKVSTTSTHHSEPEATVSGPAAETGSKGSDGDALNVLQDDPILLAIKELPRKDCEAEKALKIASEIKQLPPRERVHLKEEIYSFAEADMVVAAPLLATIVADGVLSYSDLRQLIEHSSLLRDLVAKQLDPTVPDNFRVTSLEMLKTIYIQCPPGRAALRKLLYNGLYDALHTTPVRYEAILFVLNLLQPIIAGLRAPVGEEYEKLLTQRLIPLYRNEEMLNDVLCVLSSYSVPLSNCSKGILSRLNPDSHTQVTVKVLRIIISYWEKTNSKHCVVMINSFKDLIEEMDGEVYDMVYKDLLKKLSECTGSDNAAMAMESLNLWHLDAFLQLLHRHEDDAMALIVPSLVRDGKLHWNNDVNKACLSVVNIMRSLNDSSEERFREISLTHLEKKLKMEPEEAQARLDEFLAKQEELVSHGTTEQQQLKLLKAQRSALDPRAPLPKSVNHHLRFVFGKVLGNGAYSVVKYCKRIEVEVPQSLWRGYAAKIISKKLIKDTNFDHQIEQEIRLLAHLDSPFISPLYAHFDDDRNIYIILEYCSNGDLFSNVFEKGPGTVPHEWARYGAAQIIMALQYIHEHGYYYGDVKSENVLVTETGALRLADFGSSKSDEQLEEINKRWKRGGCDFRADVQGTLDFLCPEIVTTTELTKAADWWALGVMLCQILYGYMPFIGTEDEIIDKVQRTVPKIPADAGETAELVLGLLNKDPARRFGFEECTNCSFFKKIEWDTEKLSSTKLPPLTTGHRSISSLADQKYMTRKFSMVSWNAEQLVIQAKQQVLAIAEETEEQLSWDSAKPEPTVNWVPPKVDPPKPVPKKLPPRAMPTTATPTNALADYVTTAPRTLPPRPRKQR
eukprot:TRINITY_DN5632_c0_g1_i1.p1 TRINITY_DN5632_c0_g1~~TRINITY_DN5632_c0_g1_i1.p1  ORF type:complete len:865 (+),score=323.08 TRINITY_DN5632_c0_g1_i1:2526-5120(+)